MLSFWRAQEEMCLQTEGNKTEETPGRVCGGSVGTGIFE
jgi:hypothetical protein